jgi:hypothetical protein
VIVGVGVFVGCGVEVGITLVGGATVVDSTAPLQDEVTINTIAMRNIV